MRAERDEMTVYEDVQVVRVLDMAIVYRIGMKQVHVPPLHVQRESTAQLGRPGRLVIPSWLARDLGLPMPPIERPR
jgi:hypothetical protein